MIGEPNLKPPPSTISLDEVDEELDAPASPWCGCDPFDLVALYEEELGHPLKEPVKKTI